MKTNQGLGFWFFVLTCLFFATFSIYPQQKQKQAKAKTNIEETVIATVGSEKITFGELAKAYSKNLAKKNAPLYLLSKDSLMDFLNLYLRYRLK
ncbi:MAG: hypothetical protein ACPLRO_03845, partial [Candidatus Kapaibacteriota bacterium]